MHINYNNTTIHYIKEGTGQPVVLLHGFGEDHTIWNEQVTFLKQHCLVLAPDLPGSGTSGLMHPFKTSDEVIMDDYADLISHLLKQEQIDQCILLGHSMGGYITLAFAQKFPEKLKAWGLVHSTAFADNSEKIATRKKGMEIIQKYGGYAFLKNTIPNLFAEGYKKIPDNKISDLITKSRAFTPDALVQYSQAMISRPDRTHVLRTSMVPVLFILGTEDVAAPLNDVLQQVYLPNLAFIHVLSNVGHMSMLEQPEKLNFYLHHFINMAATFKL